MADIFISYSQKDRAQVRPLVDALTAEGYEVWWDLKIRSGETFDRAIERTLKQVQCVVAIWSNYSRDSDWVRAESAWAKKRDKLVAVRIQDDVELPIQFFHVHTESMVGWDGSRKAPEFRGLVEDIQAIAGTPQNLRDSADLEDVQTDPKSSEVTNNSRASHRQVERISSVALRKLRHSDSGPATGAAKPSNESPSYVYEALSTFRDPLLDGSFGPEMVVIPTGSFWMGSPENEKGRVETEGPRHRVEITRSFAIGKTPITFAEFDRFADTTGREKPKDSKFGRGNRPVNNMSWEGAVSYAEWLSSQTGKRYRLPSEAEWEYACRAGTQTAWFVGENASDLDQYVWRIEFKISQWKKLVTVAPTEPVGNKKANPWGLLDIVGNVWEWVQDCWHDNYEGAPSDGSAWMKDNSGDCSHRVARGGCMVSVTSDLRSACRSKYTFVLSGYYGFRLARDL